MHAGFHAPMKTPIRRLYKDTDRAGRVVYYRFDTRQIRFFRIGRVRAEEAMAEGAQVVPYWPYSLTPATAEEWDRRNAARETIERQFGNED